MKPKSNFVLIVFSFLFLSLNAQENKLSTVSKASAPAIEMVPYFAGCKYYNKVRVQHICTINKIRQHIYQNLTFPATALEQLKKDRVEISYLIQADGTLKGIQMERDPGYGCGDMVLEALENLPPLVVPSDSKYLAVDANERVISSIQINNVEGFYERKRNEIIEPVEEIFQVVEDMPRYPGCEDSANKKERQRCAQVKMLEFIYKNVKYPAEARANRTEGVTVIRFVIDEMGNITQPKITRDIGDGCGEEALRVVKLMPRWIPGKQRGTPVDVYFNLPVKFKL